jgi:hypothetical protein
VTPHSDAPWLYGASHHTTTTYTRLRQTKLPTQHKMRPVHFWHTGNSLEYPPAVRFPLSIIGAPFFLPRCLIRFLSRNLEFTITWHFLYNHSSSVWSAVSYFIILGIFNLDPFHCPFHSACSITRIPSLTALIIIHSLSLSSSSLPTVFIIRHLVFLEHLYPSCLSISFCLIRVHDNPAYSVTADGTPMIPR